jgi:KDO2-lipid IV(A) lauroyltransferase
MLLLKESQGLQDYLRLSRNGSGLRNFLAHIPRTHILTLGKLLGLLLYVLNVPHRRLVRRNLQFCFPGWSCDEIQKFSKRVFKNAGITILEIFQSAFIYPKDLLRMFRAKGEENLINALKRNKNGMIIITAHLGNWEMGFQLAGCYFGKSITGVARKIGYKRLDHFFHYLRTRFGNKLIYKKGALSKMKQILRRGEILGLTIDQSRRKQGVEVMLFNREIAVTPAAAFLAIRCKCPVLPIFCVRETDGKHTVHVKPPLTMQKTNDLRRDLKVNTQIMMDVVQDMIIKYPDQWVWYQRPWKKTYPNLYPEWEARRKKRGRKKAQKNLN